MMQAPGHSAQHLDFENWKSKASIYIKSNWVHAAKAGTKKKTEKKHKSALEEAKHELEKRKQKSAKVKKNMEKEEFDL